MHCLDCDAIGQSASAVAVCMGCGAGVCADHAVVEARILTRIAVINRVEEVDVPARIVSCQICAAAAEAQSHPGHHRVRS